MAREITVLDQSTGNTGTRSVKCVFWFPITNATSKVPRPGFVSLATGLSTQEQADLEAGNTLEEIYSFDFPSSYTTAQLKAFLQARYTDRATAVAGLPATRAFWGVVFDSVTGWSA